MGTSQRNRWRLKKGTTNSEETSLVNTATVTRYEIAEACVCTESSLCYFQDERLPYKRTTMLPTLRETVVGQ